jgi:hypothetical protein
MSYMLDIVQPPLSEYEDEAGNTGNPGQDVHLLILIIQIEL